MNSMNEKFQKGFTIFVNVVLKYLFVLIIAIAGEKLIGVIKYRDNSFSIMMLIVTVILGLLLVYAIKKQINKKIILIAIIILGLVIRFIWIFSINSRPVSDFGLMYEAGPKILDGDFSKFKGINYFSRFPHLTIMVLYFAGMQKIFGLGALIPIKIVNAICSTIDIFIMYKMGREVFDEKKAIFLSFLTAVYPPLIVYTAVFCTENIAITFFLGSLYIFILCVKNKVDKKWFIVSAILLSIGNLFRMVGIVMVIAYIIYIVVYIKDKISIKLRNSAYIVLAFLLPLIIVSTSLKAMNVTENNLWSGAEPGITSILKGTNVQSKGAWNRGDALFVDVYLGNKKALQQATKERIEKRFATYPLSKWVQHYVDKFASQWSVGDFSGSFWAQLKVPAQEVKIDMNKDGELYTQGFFVILLICTILGLFNKKQYIKNKIINLFYIIFCGYGLLFTIIESQARYGFIISWLFILLSMTVVIDKEKKESIG
ncbi:membrane protein [Clostridium sp. TW13]|uniref:Membrane protein n=1 Tax=Inconstantimicrobium mannanitabidum TaxID=1604901 RepID=A0ACB5RF80_9CLOT|nr:membrane protein [Clostridium sp. TW13]